MSSAGDAAPMTAAELDALPYEELRAKAFDVAKSHHDLGFFYDLYAHTPAMHAMNGEGGSLGEIGGSIFEVYEAAQEAFGEDNIGEFEPLIRAHYIDYITKHGG